MDSPGSRGQYVVGLVILVVIAVVGLFIVKWNPYYHKVFTVAASHSLGASIVSGQASAAPSPSLAAAVGYGLAYFSSIWQALVVGLLLATTIETLLPRSWLARLLGSGTFRSAALGGAIALPGMMCTCCTSPVVVGMRRNGVSVGPALAFWLGNPTLNPATLVFILLALSWKWALLRLAIGIFLVFGVSTLASRLFVDERVSVESVAGMIPADSDAMASIVVRWFRCLGRLIVGLIPEYLVIVLLLGATRAWLFPAISLTSRDSVAVIVGLAIAGTLFVIPTAGEIPIVQTMVKYGLGTGPAGALLMTLAPISVPSVAMVWTVFPKRVLAFVAVSVAVVGIVGGAVAVLLGF